MKLWLRLLLLRASARRGRRIGLLDVSTLRMRVWPADLDALRHLNNGVYLTMMDLGRLDLMQRSGTWAVLQRAGLYPVVTAQTIAYRRSLEPWQRFDLRTKVVGFDETSAFLEQRFVVRGDVVARAYLRARFLRRSGGAIRMQEAGALTGVDVTALPVPAWLADWAARVALPPGRAAAPDDWR